MEMAATMADELRTHLLEYKLAKEIAAKKPSGTVIANAKLHAGMGGRLCPSRGWPTSTNTASEAVSSAAHPHSAQLMRW